jgi:probable HAF family extracellular repeat protein
MKRIGAAISALLVIVAALALATAAQQQKSSNIHYTIQDLGTFGGTFSWAFGINENGSIDGFAYVAGDTAFHAFLWRKGVMNDLGTLGGPYSSPNFAPNERDDVAGSAETLILDPFGDHFCGFNSVYTCPPTFWSRGVALQLPTLGGFNGIASTANNREQIVGSVENLSPGCRFYFQQKAVMWEKGQIKELPALVGDNEGYGLGINDSGQIVGWTLSADCAVFHAVLWEKGKVTDLGSLGGTFSTASGINNQGEAVGASNVSGDVTGHGFLWRKNMGMIDLGTLPGDFSSSAWGIDNKARVVGSSCDASNNCRAFLWQDGVMTDLNSLLPADSQWYLYDGEGINSRGEIVGLAFNLMSAEGHAYLATPKGAGSMDVSGAPGLQKARATFTVPEHLRKLLQQRQNQRLGMPKPQ